MQQSPKGWGEGQAADGWNQFYLKQQHLIASLVVYFFAKYFKYIFSPKEIILYIIKQISITASAHEQDLWMAKVLFGKPWKGLRKKNSIKS